MDGTESTYLKFQDQIEGNTSQELNLGSELEVGEFRPSVS